MSNDDTLETGVSPEAGHLLRLYEVAKPESRLRIMLLLEDLREMGSGAPEGCAPCPVCGRVDACDDGCAVRRATELLAALEHTVAGEEALRQRAPAASMPLRVVPAYAAGSAGELAGARRTS